jgi:hypothetical protein
LRTISYVIFAATLAESCLAFSLRQEARFRYEIPDHVSYEWIKIGTSYHCRETNSKTGVVDKNPPICPIDANCKYTLERGISYSISSSGTDPFTGKELFPLKKLSPVPLSNQTAEVHVFNFCQRNHPGYQVMNKVHGCFGHNHKVMTDTMDAQTGYLRFIEVACEPSSIKIKTHYTTKPLLRKSEQHFWTASGICYEVDDQTGGFLYAEVAPMLQQLACRNEQKNLSPHQRLRVNDSERRGGKEVAGPKTDSTKRTEAIQH